MTTVYKVVFTDGDSFLSACAGLLRDEPDDDLISPNDSDVIVRYKIGHKSVPNIKNSYLYAFAEKKYATDFIRHIHNGPASITILLCEAEVVEIPPYFRPLDRFDTQFGALRDIINFWKGDIQLRFPAPDGTVLCKSITPLEDIIASFLKDFVL